MRTHAQVHVDKGLKVSYLFGVLGSVAGTNDTPIHTPYLCVLFLLGIFTRLIFFISRLAHSYPCTTVAFQSITLASLDTE
jgi:hypothetical protein